LVKGQFAVIKDNKIYTNIMTVAQAVTGGGNAQIQECDQAVPLSLEVEYQSALV